MAEAKDYIAIQQFSAGLNERDDHTFLQEGEHVRPTHNIRLTKRGSFSKGPGFDRFYNEAVDWPGVPVSSMFSALIQEQVVWHIWGADRYKTNINANYLMFSQSNSAVIARGDGGGDYSDPAAATALAEALEAPLLLVDGSMDKIPHPTRKALSDLRVENIYLIGGTAAISSDMEDAFKSNEENFNVQRIYGPDRAHTSCEIANEVDSITDATLSDTCYIVGWDDEQKADSIAAIPAVTGVDGNIRPIFFVPEDGLVYEVGEEEKTILEDTITDLGFSNAVILGGTARVSSAVESDLSNLGLSVTRIAGANRTETAVEFAEHLFDNEGFEHIMIVNGEDQHCIDGVAGGILAASMGAAIIFIGRDSDYIISTAEDFLDDYITHDPLTKVFVMGGPEAISPDVVSKIEEKIYIPLSQKYFIATAGDKVKKWDDENNEWDELSSGAIEGGNQVDFAFLNHAVYAVDGEKYFTIAEDLLEGEIKFKEVVPYIPTDEEIINVGPNALVKRRDDPPPSEHYQAGTVIRPQHIISHKDRIWLSAPDESRVYMSDIGAAGDTPATDMKMFRPDYIPTSNYLTINCQKGDEITGMVNYQDKPFIFTRNSIWAVYGESPGEYQLVNIAENIGAVSHRSIYQAKDFLYFLSPDGPVAFDGTNIYPLYDRIPDTVKEIDWKKAHMAATVSYDDHVYIAVSDENAEESEYNNLILDFNTFMADLYNPQSPRPWVRHEGLREVRCWTVDEDYNLLFGGQNGYIYQFDEGYGSYGGLITSKYTTPIHTFGFRHGVRVKRFRIKFESYAGSGTMYFKHRMDGGDWVTTELDITPGEPYSDINYLTKTVGANSIGHNVQCQIEYQGNDYFSVSGIEMECYIRKSRRY